MIDGWIDGRGKRTDYLFLLFIYLFIYLFIIYPFLATPRNQVTLGDLS